MIARGSSTPYKKTTKTPQEIAKELDGELSADRDRPVAEGRRHEPRAGHAGARRDRRPTARRRRSGSSPSTPRSPTSSRCSRTSRRRWRRRSASRSRRDQEKRLSEKPTQNLAAYDAYLKGEDALTLVAPTRPACAGLAFYEQAVALDPGFAQAWAGSRSRTRSFTATRCRTRSSPSGPAGRGESDRPRSRSGGGIPALGNFYRLVVEQPGRALDVISEGPRLVAGNADAHPGHRLCRSRAGTPGAGGSSTSGRRRASTREASATRRSGPCAPAAAAPRRSARSLRSCARGLAGHPVLDRESGDDVPRGRGPPGRPCLVASSARPSSIRPLVAFFANYQDWSGSSTSARWRSLLRLTPADVRRQLGVWALCLAQAKCLEGRRGGATRAHAEKARRRSRSS